MNSIVVNSDLPNDPDVRLNDGSVISMQTMQHIYNEITGRSEELSRYYSQSHCITYEDIKQLNAKIVQLYEQYHIQARNCAVTLYHLDDQKQIFSSFERFELFDRTTLSPVENIRLEYNFLIVLPIVNSPQKYEIEINIQSRATMLEREKKENPFRSEFFFSLFGQRTALVEIKYIDYTVARNFQIAIDGWFKGLTCTNLHPVVAFLKRFMDAFPLAFRLVFVPWFLYTCAQHFLPILQVAGYSSEVLYQASVVTFGGAFLLSTVVARMGAILSNAIRRTCSISYLNLTRGDENAINSLKGTNSAALIKGILGLLGGIAAKVIASWICVSLGIGK